ncbi:MAG TPA: (2Fe-2S)-binding protein [Roseomonas sp.]|jgi:nicotinate dehydrogenase subunit A
MHCTVNGAAVTFELPEEVPLIHALRDGLGLFGTRFGCGAEQCGACMILLDGQPTPSCTLSLGAAAGRAVQTVEGLPIAHALQRAFLAEQAGQCGYCLSGMLVSATALLARQADPDAASIRAALEPHLCRCGAHNRILRAVRRAAAELRDAAA